MRNFKELYELAVVVKGGVDVLESSLPRKRSQAQLRSRSDAEYLSLMSRRVFRAGLRHAMVDKKWPAFEAQFKAFDPHFCAMMSDEAIEACLTNKSIIRHFGKIKSIRANAQNILYLSNEYGSFGDYLADWPMDNIVGLWLDLKKRGSMLGGNSGPYFLRMAGFDTFLLTSDVLAVLTLEGIVEGKADAQRDMRACEAAFLQWQSESGRPLCEISRIVSYCAL